MQMGRGLLLVSRVNKVFALMLSVIPGIKPRVSGMLMC